MSAAKRKSRRAGVVARKAEKISLIIQSLNRHGQGVGYYDTHRLQVGNTLPGEEVLVEYAPERPRKSRIRLLKILRKSPHRRAAPCRYFRDCGGCQLQHLDYQKQLEYKREVLQNQLREYEPLRR